jgi:hypothetical protein
MKKTTRAFLLLAGVIALLEGVIVTFNYQKQKDLLETNLQQKFSQVQTSFELAYNGTRQRMLEIASYAANSPDVQQAFLAGRKAVEREGGAAGGADAATARKRLLELSQQSWKKLKREFDFRQMQFHLPPGDTSFLRVHAPHRFGDDLSPIRHTIVTANREQKMVSGFETGRAHSGVRGAAPVFAQDQEKGQRVHVGTLEFGTSLKQTISSLSENQNVDISILLSLKHLEQIVWPDVLAKKLAQNGSVEGYLIEETTLPDAREFFQQEEIPQLLNAGNVEPHRHDHGYHWLATFPLRDFLGEKQPQRAAVGLVVFSQDVTADIQLLSENLNSSIVIAIIGFVLILIVLLLVLRLTTGRLERMVEKGREELELKNEKLHEDLQTIQKMQLEKQELIDDLQSALQEVQTLGGLLPICAYCKKIRDDKGYWNRLESYIESNSEAQFSHGICDDCMDERFPGVKDEED